jgi:hypothetical protein
MDVGNPAFSTASQIKQALPWSKGGWEEKAGDDLVQYRPDKEKELTNRKYTAYQLNDDLVIGDLEQHCCRLFISFRCSADRQLLQIRYGG